MAALPGAPRPDCGECEKSPEIEISFLPHPIITVGLPSAADAPQAQVSPTRSAGLPPIITVALPIKNGLADGPCWGGKGQLCKSPSTAAGLPPIVTVGTPGPVIEPPWLLMSPTQAAAGIAR